MRILTALLSGALACAILIGGYVLAQTFYQVQGSLEDQFPPHDNVAFALFWGADNELCAKADILCISFDGLAELDGAAGADGVDMSVLWEVPAAVSSKAHPDPVSGAPSLIALPAMSYAKDVSTGPDYIVVSGTSPREADEVGINLLVADTLGVEIGDTVTLHGRRDEGVARDFRVTGLLGGDDNFLWAPRHRGFLGFPAWWSGPPIVLAPDGAIALINDGARGVAWIGWDGEPDALEPQVPAANAEDWAARHDFGWSWVRWAAGTGLAAAVALTALALRRRASANYLTQRRAALILAAPALAGAVAAYVTAAVDAYWIRAQWPQYPIHNTWAPPAWALLLALSAGVAVMAARVWREAAVSARDAQPMADADHG